MNLTEIDNSFALLHLYKSTEARLQILKQLVEYWHGTITPKYSIPSSQMEHLEMPQILRWWYEWAGKHDSIMSGENTLVSPAELKIDQGRVVFHVDNNGEYLWSTLAAGEDPPVFGRYIDEQQWTPEGIQLSEHLINTCIFEAVVSHAPYKISATDISDETLQELLKLIPPLPIKGWRWSGGSSLCTMRGAFMHIASYENGDSFLHSAWIAARENQTLEAAKLLLNR